VLGSERTVVRNREVGRALLMCDEISRPIECTLAAIDATATIECGSRRCSRCDPGCSSRALVSECHKAIPGQVQTRSRTGVACMILTQVRI